MASSSSLIASAFGVSGFFRFRTKRPFLAPHITRTIVYLESSNRRTKDLSCYIRMHLTLLHLAHDSCRYLTANEVEPMVCGTAGCLNVRLEHTSAFWNTFIVFTICAKAKNINNHKISEKAKLPGFCILIKEHQH